MEREARNAWRDGIADGDDPATVSDRLLSAADDLPPPDRLRWLAELVKIQWESGRMQALARDRFTLELDGPAAAELPGATARAFRRLADKLTTPAPPPKKMRHVPAGPDVGVHEGDVVRLWSPDRTRAAIYAVLYLYPFGRTFWPHVLALYCPDGAERVTPDEAGRLGPLEHSQLAPWDDGTEPRQHMTSGRAYQVTVMVPRNRDRFTPEIGEIIAREAALDRWPPADIVHPGGIEPRDMTTWHSLMHGVGGVDARRREKAMRHFLADPDRYREAQALEAEASERRRAEAYAEAPPHVRAVLDLMEQRQRDLYGEE